MLKNFNIGIYKITNLVNNKCDIGQSTNLSKRLNRHKNDLKNNRHFNKHLQNAYNKYGLDKFSFNIIERGLSEDELDDYEIDYIKLYNSTDRKFGYNIRSGGEANHKMADETKQKLSKAKTGVSLSEEHKLAISKGSKGKELSEEHIKNISESKKGDKNPMHGVEPWNKGKNIPNTWQRNTSLDVAKELIITLYLVCNKSRQEIADIYGVSRKTIGKRFKSWGILKYSKLIF
jgi:group I intron endonuclease